MLATVAAGHSPVVREVNGTRVLETIGPGSPLVVLWAYGDDRLVVVTKRHMGHVAAEFVTMQPGGDVSQVQARVDGLEAGVAT